MRTNHSVRTAILLVAISLSLIVPTAAQIAGGLSETTQTGYRGKHFISGTIFSPAGLPVRARTRIRLSSLNGEIVTTTDDTGKFVFSGLDNGTYWVFVDEDEQFETASSSVEIAVHRNDLAQTFTVALRLRDKQNKLKKPDVVETAKAGIPKAAAAYYARATELAKSGDHKGAIEQLKLAVAEYPQFVVAWNEMGVQNIKLNQFDEADKNFLAALKIKPDTYEPLVNRGILLVRLKRYPEAEAELRKALAVNDTAVVHFYLGRAAAAEKRYDEAEKEFNQSITLGGEEMKEAHRMLSSIYLEKGDDRRALAALETYLKLNPNAPDAEKLRESAAQIKQALAQTPEKP